MKRFHIVLTILALLLATSVALAQSGADYDMKQSLLSGGGGISSSGDFAVSGSIGQASTGNVSGGDYTLAGGYWSSASALASTRYYIYLPLVMRSYAGGW